MPTGIRLSDPRQQLFDAAERVLLRDGPHALTSRAVTDEAGCAKGVLHRHFADFDGFLTELVLDRSERLAEVSATLINSVGQDTVAANLTTALQEFFGPVPVAIIPLIIIRDDLRSRLRSARPGGGAGILGQLTRAVADYLTAERDRGRLAADIDIDSVTLSLVGGGNLLATEEGGLPRREAVHKLVTAAIADAVHRSPAGVETS